MTWKVFGPDLNGRYGGLQGTGGLEAVILDAGGTTTGVINDQFGNGVATVSGGTVTWNTTRVGAYGPLPGVQAQTLGDVTQLAAATAWRSRRIDPTGFYWLGARYYEPTSGRFLSADPMGHAASPSLYDYAGGDPVNNFDPDGRCLNKIGQFGKAFGDEALKWGGRADAGLAELYNVGQDWFTAGLSLYMQGDIPSDLKFESNTFNDSGRPTVNYLGVDMDAKIVLGTGQTATFGVPNIAIGGYDLATGDYQGAQDNLASSFFGLTAVRSLTNQPGGNASSYTDTTNPGASVPNVTTSVTADQAGATLTANGFTKTVSADGQAAIYRNASGDTYVIRPSNSAPGGMAADYVPSGGGPKIKINFGKK